MPPPPARRAQVLGVVGKPLTTSYERGVDLVAIQQMLGHWHVGTTMRYAVTDPARLREAVERVPGPRGLTGASR
jgi:integrase/recombinase XerD